MSHLFLLSTSSLCTLIWFIFLIGLFASSDGLTEKIVPLKKSGGASSDCEEMLISFAVASGNFTYCTIRNARPITLCKKCVKTYLTVRQIYKDISGLKDRGGESCKDELFNLDRLQAVDAGFKYVRDLWARASCDSCFVLDSSGCPTTVLTAAVQEILNISDILNSCIDTYHNGSAVPDVVTCKACGDDYLKLNNVYNSIKADNGEINYCMDIIDLINSTRSEWSGTLGCCHDRRKPELIFLLSSAAVSILSALFYLMAYAFTTKKEQKLLHQNRWSEGTSVQR